MKRIINGKEENEIREVLRRCKLDSPLYCGNCPYVRLRNDNDITKCTSEMAKNAEKLIDELLGNHLHIIGVD